jgi:hypothetical protein
MSPPRGKPYSYPELDDRHGEHDFEPEGESRIGVGLHRIEVELAEKVDTGGDVEVDAGGGRGSDRHQGDEHYQSCGATCHHQTSVSLLFMCTSCVERNVTQRVERSCPARLPDSLGDRGIAAILPQIASEESPHEKGQDRRHPRSGERRSCDS